MGITQPDKEVVLEALHATFRKLYGQDILTALLWLPPGDTTFEFASNVDPKALISALRDAADNVALGPLAAHRIRRPPAG